MSPIPVLPLKIEDIPDEITDEVLTKLAQSFVILTNYTAVEYERCGKER